MPYNKNIDRQPTMITVTFTAEQIAAFTEALDRAVDCPMLEDDNSTDLVLNELSGKLEGAADAARAAAWAPLSFPVLSFNQHHMRKIETLMNAAIKGNKNWSNSNTTVTTVDGVSTVHLHGNKIAEVGDDFVRIFDGGWQSNTTKSRLNAIINEFCNAFTDGVFQKDFQWYVRDNKVIHDFVNGYTFAEFA